MPRAKQIPADSVWRAGATNSQPLVQALAPTQQAAHPKAISLAKGPGMTTLFEVLGVPPNATDEAVRTAFRRAAKAYHPDLNLGDPAAAQKLREIVAAYKSLKTSEQRAAYNRYLATEEQYWRNIGRENKKERRFAQPAVAGLVTGSVVALAVWGSLSLSNRQERSEPQQTSRVAAATTQPQSRQIDGTDDSSGRRKESSSEEPRVASATPDDPQHRQPSTDNSR